jgi:hypothetical protein
VSDPPAPFRRRPPSLGRQVAWGLWTHGVLAPIVWSLERLGLARSTFSAILSHRNEALIEHNPLAGYAPRPQDVFVATYPKSGTNWMLQIAMQLVHQGAARFEHIHDVVPWPDARMMPLHGGAAIPLDAPEGWRDAPEGRRVIKTHLHARELPLASPARFLMVIRDPKDVFVSSYFFVRDTFLGPAMPSVKTWYRLFLTGKTIGGNWVHSTAGYWRARARENVKVLSFKAMKQDLPGTVRDVATFLGIRASDDVLASVCEQASFAAMKRIDEKFRVGRRIPWREGAMLRRGAQGGAGELLSFAQQRELDDYFVSELRRHHCHLPYEDFADPA